MIKVVLDANQFVSGVITSKGNSSRILDLVKEDKIKLLISSSILNEIRRVLFYPHLKKIHKFGYHEIDEGLKKISSFAKFTTEGSKINAIKDDPSDNKYLECAVSGEADFIISGDHHLLNLKTYQGVKIISPAEFLKGDDKGIF